MELEVAYPKQSLDCPLGECLQYAIAYALKFEPKSVPHFTEHSILHDVHWPDLIERWLLHIGIEPSPEFELPILFPTIVLGKTNRKGSSHAVALSPINNSDKVLKYDPHPSNSFLSKIDGYIVLKPKS